MQINLLSLFYLGLTVLFSSYGQIVLKWRLKSIGPLPAGIWEKVVFMSKAYTDGWILSGFFSAFLASVCWIAAISKVNLSVAYPFMGLSFILVLFFSHWLLKEPITRNQVIGTTLIFLGILLSAQK